MLNRTIAIITCLSLVGVSLVPASLVPCCCKGKLGAQQVSSLPSCPECPVAAPSGSKHSPLSCCAKTQADAPACCAKNSLQPNCPRCRCLEQMQVVALSPVSSDQVSVRVLPAVHADEAPSVNSQTLGAFPILHAGGPPGSFTFLSTCSLRC
jgi:hypothetical protein